jgi:hypothetical protein
MNIAGSVALVTGANRGPGKALVAALLSFASRKDLGAFLYPLPPGILRSRQEVAHCRNFT